LLSLPAPSGPREERSAPPEIELIIFNPVELLVARSILESDMFFLIAQSFRQPQRHRPKDFMTEEAMSKEIS